MVWRLVLAVDSKPAKTQVFSKLSCRRKSSFLQYCLEQQCHLDGKLPEPATPSHMSWELWLPQWDQKNDPKDRSSPSVTSATASPFLSHLLSDAPHLLSSFPTLLWEPSSQSPGQSLKDHLLRKPHAWVMFKSVQLPRLILVMETLQRISVTFPACWWGGWVCTHEHEF